ncbi:putative high mobility group B2 protein-like isoform 1 [Capsicum annuum]|nr:putative high mobility group B2 protein-like isoform 1 [Capsicum annuum]
MLIALAAVYGLEIHQMYVKIAFLNGELEEEIYMEQPEGFVVPGKENKVCKHIKSLYGLKQAPKQWHAKFDKTMLANGFNINECDKCVNIKDTLNHQVIVCLYVDDMLVISRDMPDINATKRMLESKFDMKDLGVADVILGIRIHRTPQGLALSQSHYIENVLDKFKYMEFSIVKTLSFERMKVVLLNEHTESRTVKVGLHPPESCLDMEIISSIPALRKNINNSLLLVAKSGQVYTYDDSLIERYLIQYQSRSPPSLPREVKVKLPIVDSSITVATFIVNNPYMLFSMDQDYSSLIKDSIPLFPFERGQKDGTGSNSTQFSKAKNVFVSGDSNGAINLWDVSCPNPLPIVSLTQQSEDNHSLSGVPLTALCLTSDLHILISGDQSGTVRIYKFKTEFFAPDTSFLSFQGSKKGSNPIQSIKLVKVNGAVLSISTSQDSKYIAVGSDQGYVVLIDSDSKTILYQTHIASELCTGVISMQFNTCSLHGFDKNILLVATKDSSVLALETETGNILSPSRVHPKKPSRALFMQILEGQELSGRGLSISDGIDMIKGNSDNIASKQPLVLLCSEKAVYVYSLLHIIQGIKKVYYKKKFHSSLCCWASTFDTPEAGLMLLFSNGKIEIRRDKIGNDDIRAKVGEIRLGMMTFGPRSLPELSLLKESSVRGLSLSPPKANSIADHSVCASKTGELVVVDRDQEMFFVSVSLQTDTFRFLDIASQVYDRDLVVEPGQISAPTIQKEKKKGIFGSVFKDAKGNKANNLPDAGVENARLSIEEMSALFSADNFPSLTHSEEKLGRNENDADLDIDDIEIEDPGEKQKGNPMVAALNKQNLTNTFQALKGKFMHMKVKADKAPVNDAPQDDKADTVGQIKKRYGYTASAEPGAAEATKSKLSENLKKLQGINIRSAEMQDQAKSFSSMAKEVLRFSGNDKPNS